jgi:hypothetical protein
MAVTISTPTKQRHAEAARALMAQAAERRARHAVLRQQKQARKQAQAEARELSRIRRAVYALEAHTPHGDGYEALTDHGGPYEGQVPG